jgi:hypothetical protein
MQQPTPQMYAQPQQQPQMYAQPQQPQQSQQPQQPQQPQQVYMQAPPQVYAQPDMKVQPMQQPPQAAYVQGGPQMMNADVGSGAVHYGLNSQRVTCMHCNQVMSTNINRDPCTLSIGSSPFLPASVASSSSRTLAKLRIHAANVAHILATMA